MIKYFRLAIFSCLVLFGFASCYKTGKKYNQSPPDSTRYTRTVLAEGLDEPMQMAILPGNDVLFVERKGGVKLYKDVTKELRVVANFDVFSGIEDGLLGVVADPEYEKNHWLYFYYAVAGDSTINRLSRIEFRNDTLLWSTETVILEVPTQRVHCCHSAGYLRFDKHGNLYLSTGDNTNAEETEGYTPIDERPGRGLSDDQATAANTNDLRGKILRINPLPQGGYRIPEGNLFPEGSAKARPEIYVMGMRNPYRFSIDDETGYLYFGDVGPDTKVVGGDGELMSYDEINQVREPGFFGWPYFLGNNDVFPKYDYETKELGPGKDPEKPLNESPNNTGLRELPPAKPAMIWYGKGESEYFPLVGSGGATAMAGPVFYSKHFKDAPFKLSDYYDGKLFIYEWIRGWIMAVTFDEAGRFKQMEPFLGHWKFDAPVDMQFAPDGSIYMLEYGTNWFSKNTNSKLVRIEYVKGNRHPIPAIEVDHQYGAAPFTVMFSAYGTIDYDLTDSLAYHWEIDSKTYNGKAVSHTFTTNGIYEAILSVTDDNGGIGTTGRRVYVGNTPPEVRIATDGNCSFYWDGTALNYRVSAHDEEERIDPERLSVSFGYVPNGTDAAIVLTSGQDVASFQHVNGLALISSFNCQSCHSLDQESVGPTYRAVAKRYAGQAEAKERLVRKIIEGGSGNWGERAMSPHPDLSEAEAAEMVDYILSLTANRERLPLAGRLPFTEHIGTKGEGVYLLSATYQDRGANGIPALVGRDFVALRHPLVQAENFDEGNVKTATTATDFVTYTDAIKDGSYIAFRDIDLNGVKQMGVRVQTSGAGGRIEIRSGSVTGPLIGTVAIPGRKPRRTEHDWTEYRTPVTHASGKHWLYMVFRNEVETNGDLFNVDWFYFYNR